MKKSLLMTGASGLVGTRFVEMFADKYQVYNLDLTNGVDITDRASIEKFIVEHPADTLIHLAAFTDTNQAFAETGDKNGLCYKVNVLGTKNITGVCKDKNIHLIHISTDYVFDGTKTTPYVETDQLHPLEWYGETKKIAEDVVANSGVDYTIVRLAYPYRANFASKPDLLAKIRHGLVNHNLPPQFSDTLITPTFIDDISRGFDRLIENSAQGIYHFVGSSSISPYHLAQKVAEAFKLDPSEVKKGSLTEYLKTTSRPFARNVAVSNAKAINELELNFHTIDQGLVEIQKQLAP